jgi:ubiquinone/menaquinone biosynthesis C-methylase UbiE
MYYFNYATMVDPLLKEVRSRVTVFSEAGPGQKILDVCCGTGDQVFYYSRKGADASGIDSNAGMIKTARNNQDRLGKGNTSFYLADAAELPFPDNYFDCASVSLCLHEMERDQRAKTVTAMKRVVKPGGILIFTDFTAPLAKNLIGFFLGSAEFLAGSRNYSCFRDYLERGGLNYILSENCLKTQEEALMLGSNLRIVKAANT